MNNLIFVFPPFAPGTYHNYYWQKRARRSTAKKGGRVFQQYRQFLVIDITFLENRVL
jgi:hypothetical protein